MVGSLSHSTALHLHGIAPEGCLEEMEMGWDERQKCSPFSYPHPTASQGGREGGQVEEEEEEEEGEEEEEEEEEEEKDQARAQATTVQRHLKVEEEDQALTKARARKQQQTVQRHFKVCPAVCARKKINSFGSENFHS